MKLKSKLMLFTAAAALSANMAFAAINPETLAAAYQAEGYTYVEIKVGPTQTKLEAVKGDRKVEVIYDNASGDVIKQEFDSADDYSGRTGVEIQTAARDFEDDSSDSNDDEDDASDDDESDDDDNGGDDDESDDDEGDDDSGSDDDESDDDESDSDSSDRSDDDKGDDEGSDD